MKDQITKAVQELGGPNGFWKGDAEQELHECYKKLMDAGASFELADEVICTVWSICRDEYGD